MRFFKIKINIIPLSLTRPNGRPARETLLGGEWRVLSLRALPPGIGRGVNCPPPGLRALAQPGGRSWPLRKQLGCSVCTVVFIQCTHCINSSLYTQLV
jgi:hypothetical protein